MKDQGYQTLGQTIKESRSQWRLEALIQKNTMALSYGINLNIPISIRELPYSFFGQGKIACFMHLGELVDSKLLQ